MIKHFMTGYTKNTPNNKAFTLIELLVVIAIIGLLSSVILAPIQSSRKKARDAQRVSSLTSIRTALSIYYDDNGSYPVTSNWQSQCPGWGSFANNAVIPGLVPNYLPRMPVDTLNTTFSTNNYCYLYYSTGQSYKVLFYNVGESNPPANFVDPVRTGGYWMICEGTVACTTW